MFLEYAKAMDTNEDWAEKKEQEENDRYSSLTISATGRKAAGKPLKQTLQLEYEAPAIQTSS